MSLFRRAVATGSRNRSYKEGISEGSRDRSNNSNGCDPLSLCGFAQLLLAPYHRRHPRPLLPEFSLPPVERKGNGGHNSGGGGTAADRLETGLLYSPLPPKVSKAATQAAATEAVAVPPTRGRASTAEEALPPLTFPSDEDKNEAARLLARAFSLAGGEVPSERVYFGERGDNDDNDGESSAVGENGDDGDFGVAERDSGRQGRGLAEVHLAVSGFSLHRDHGGGSGGGAVDTRGRSGAGGRQRDDGSSDGANEWHLREAARISPPNTKVGITAR